MSLLQRQYSSAACEAFFSAIGRVPAPSVDPVGGGGPGGPAAQSPDSHYGHPVYSMGIPGLAGVAALSPRLIGTNFTLPDSNGLCVSGDVPENAVQGVALRASKKLGPAVDKSHSAFLQLSSFREVATNDFEVRLLRIPGLRFEAFWLKAPPYLPNFSADDLVYPFISFHKEIPESQIVSMTDFMKVARPLAIKEASLPRPR